MAVKPPPIPPTYEEVTQLSRRLTERNQRKRRYRNGLTATLIIGILLIVMSLIIGWISPDMIVMGWFLGIGLFSLLVGLMGVIASYVSFDVSKTVSRLVLANDPRAVPALIDALYAASQLSDHSDDVLRSLRLMLAALIPQMTEEDISQIAPPQWKLIYDHLNSQTVSRTFGNNDEFALAIAYLNLVQRCQDTKPLAAVRSLAKGRGGRDEIQRMRAAANACLEVLEEQKRREDAPSVLLRASEPKSHSETLLRPAGQGGAIDAQQLLRADKGSPPE